MPYTTLVSGTTITASWANASVRDQVITPFASVAARDSAITSPVNGMFCYTTDEAFTWRYNGTKWLRETTTVMRTSDASAISSNTTLANDSVLFFRLDANASYQFKFMIGAIAGTGNGLKLALTFPAGARLDYRREGRAVADTWFEDWVANAASGATSAWGSSAGGSGIAPIFEGLIANGATTGNLQLQAAQNTSSGTAVQILQGAHVIYRQVA